MDQRRCPPLTSNEKRATGCNQKLYLSRICMKRSSTAILIIIIKITPADLSNEGKDMHERMEKRASAWKDKAIHERFHRELHLSEVGEEVCPGLQKPN
mgnify:CR=1 FL=1